MFTGLEHIKTHLIIIFLKWFCHSETLYCINTDFHISKFLYFYCTVVFKRMYSYLMYIFPGISRAVKTLKIRMSENLSTTQNEESKTFLPNVRDFGLWLLMLSFEVRLKQNIKFKRNCQIWFGRLGVFFRCSCDEEIFEDFFIETFSSRDLLLFWFDWSFTGILTFFRLLGM